MRTEPEAREKLEKVERNLESQGLGPDPQDGGIWLALRWMLEIDPELYV